MDEVDDTLQPVGIGLGQHPVAEIEDVYGAAESLENVASVFFDHIPRSQDDRRIEISLQDLVRPESRTGRVEWHPPVDPHHLGARPGHQFQQLRGAHTEMDAWNCSFEAAEYRGRGRQYVAFLVGGGEMPGPAIEQLDRVDPG